NRFPDRVRAAKDIERQLLRFVFVRRIPPGECPLIKIISPLNENKEGEKRLECPTIPHMNLHASTGLLLEFMKRGLKPTGTERDAGQFVPVQETRQLVGTDKGRAGEFKRSCGTASFR